MQQTEPSSPRGFALIADTRLVHITDQRVPPFLVFEYAPYPGLQPVGVSPETPAGLEAQPVHEGRLPMSHEDGPGILLFANL